MLSDQPEVKQRYSSCFPGRANGYFQNLPQLEAEAKAGNKLELPQQIALGIDRATPGGTAEYAGAIIQEGSDSTAFKAKSNVFIDTIIDSAPEPQGEARFRAQAG